MTLPDALLSVSEEDRATLGDILERGGVELQALRAELGPPGWFEDSLGIGPPGTVEDSLDRAKDRAIDKAIADGVCVYCGKATTQKDGVCWACGEQRREEAGS